MTFPIVYVTVTASYLKPDGGAAVGTVTFTPSITPVAADTIVPTAVAVTLVDGLLSTVLLATDDPDWAAPGWTYRVTERIAGARPRSYDIVVPSASATLDLAAVAPVVDPAIVTPYLLATSVGAPGGLASLDGAGQVPLSQLGNAPGGGGGSGTPADTVTSGISYGASAAAGAATTYSRGDHAHGTPALPTPAGIGAATSGHTHSGTYDPAGTAAAAVSTHAGASDPHGDRAFATSAVATHEADTTAVHGIADTSALLTSAAAAAAYQPLDSDLTTLAGLTPTTNNFIVATSSAWASRTPAQAKVQLSLVRGDVGLANVDNTSDANKPVSTATQTALDLKAPLASPTFTGTVAGITAAMVGAIATTLPDAKGDVLTATADNAPARLAVGTDGQVLTADSTQTTGLKWSTASGGGTDYKVAAKPKTGLWYRAPSFGPVGSNLSMATLNRCYFVPFRLAATTTFDRIGVDVATAGTATAVLRLGIYSADASGDLPGTLILDAGTVAGDSTGAKQATISQSLAAGTYWLCVANQVASGTAIRAIVSYDPLIYYATGASMFTGTQSPGSMVAVSISGAFASNPTISDNDNGPIIGVRAA